MSSFKPPRTPRSPFLKKENVDNTKRRRVGVTANMVGPTISRSRSILSTINSGLNGASQSDNLSDVASNIGIDFTCKEDVQALLAERLKFKKNDFKGRCEQQSEYIRKLRGCINWQMEQIDAQLTEKETLLSSLESEHTRHSQQECEMKKKIEELGTTIEELTRDLESLQEAFNQETAAKKAALEAYQTEKELKISAENSVETLEIELEKTREESERLSNELMVVRDNSKRLTEYNNSLQQYNSNLQAERAKEHEKNQILEKEKSIIRDEMASLKDQNRSLLAQINSSKSSQQEALSQRDMMSREVECLRSELNAVRDERDNTHSKFQNLNNELESFKAMFGKSSKDLDNLVAKTTALEETCESQREQIVMLKSQLMTENEKFKLADRSADVAISEYEEAKNKIESLQERLSNAELRLLEGEKLRKKLHNTIQELKGNIRVFCRVRPVINNVTESDKSVVSFPTSTEAAGRGIDLINQGQIYNFMFDKVFGSESSQQDVFVEISQLVQSALDGYKVCIFAYGQTGSGKTFTMMGKNQSLDQKGLIPRSLEQIFETSRELKNQGWRYRIQASMLEIYNETIRDLLKPGQPDASDSKCYNVATHDKDGNAMVDVHSIKEVSFLLKQAAKSRSVGRTQMNEESSRSHFVFTLCISGTNESTGQQVQGALNLIDLAGSERLAKSGSTGDRLKETQAINRSLSALGDVIFAIAKKEKHIPYRNSKLTMHLEPYLGGDSKTLMFVNVSPEASSCGESLCSLRFAARVNSCEIGIPRRQTQVVVPQIRC